MPPRLTIEVDEEVFEFLQNNATPLIDTPNDVIRRLLLPKSPNKKAKGAAMLTTNPTPVRHVSDANEFVRQILSREFGTDFARRGRYRFMFESTDRLVYFQNFNQCSSHLWYRITERPWRDLQSSQKNAILCFTNPADRFAYVIPVRDVLERVARAGWNRNYLEVNIDPVASRWVELDWKIGQYLKQY